jgi:hypothetical protein
VLRLLSTTTAASLVSNGHRVAGNGAATIAPADLFFETFAPADLIIVSPSTGELSR